MIIKFFLMIKNIFLNLDIKAFKIMKNGLLFCSSLCFVAIFILLIYQFTFYIPTIFNIGLTLFRISLIFAIEFIICAIAIDKIKKQLT